LRFPHGQLPSRQPSARQNPIERPNSGHDRLRRPPIRRRGVGKALLDQLAKSGYGNGWHQGEVGDGLPAPTAEQLSRLYTEQSPKSRNALPVFPSGAA